MADAIRNGVHTGSNEKEKASGVNGHEKMSAPATVGAATAELGAASYAPLYNVRMARVACGSLVVMLMASAASAQTPQPFPRPGASQPQPPRPASAAAQAPPEPTTQ